MHAPFFLFIRGQHGKNWKMNEQNTELESTTTGATEGTSQEATGAEPGQQTETPSESEKTFTQADLEQIVKQRLAKAKTQAEAKAEQAAADAEAKALAEQGEFKKLYEQSQLKVAETAEQLAAMQRQKLATDIAAKIGLPATLATRLQGQTEEELEMDAKILLESLPKPTAPNLNSSPGDSAPKAGQLSETDRELLAAKYGVNPQYLQ